MCIRDVGFLKVTPAHDPNDWEVGLRHDLPVINVFGPDGSISREHGWPDEEFTSGRAAEAEEHCMPIKDIINLIPERT